MGFVTILHPHPPLRGQRCEVIRVRRGTEPDVILRLPDGSRALIYIRQATLLQGREHTASTAPQSQLTQRGRELGWPEQLIGVIDQAHGRAGASAVGRTGFEYLIAAVGRGRAGAVVSVAASPLARASSEG